MGNKNISNIDGIWGNNTNREYAGLTPYEETGTFNMGSIFGGISLLFGAIAYRMAKKRKLGVVKSSFIRITIEVICIIIAW